MCELCLCASASHFCLCPHTEFFLCPRCLPRHRYKSPYIDHTLFPISAHGQHTNLALLASVRDRGEKVHRAEAELIANIDRIDECIEEVAKGVDRIVAAVRQWGDELTHRLGIVKESLEAAVFDAIREVDSTITEENPFLANSWAVNIREFNGNLASFRHFEYKFDDICVLNSLDFVCMFEMTKPDIKQLRLPGIYGNTLRIYDVRTHKTIPFALRMSFTDGIRLCFISPEAVLCVGGYPASASAHIICLSNALVTETTQMINVRRRPGLIGDSDWAYAFGGGVKSCEKYHILQGKWTRLADMRHPRTSFSPCKHGTSIFLVDVRYPMEVLNVTSGVISLANVTIVRDKSSSIACIIQDELIVVTCGGQVARWKVGTEDVRVERFENRGEDPSCQGEPVVVGKFIYFVRWETGNLNVFDLETNLLSKQ